jgi:hypothetical protein
MAEFGSTGARKRSARLGELALVLAVGDLELRPRAAEFGGPA